MLADPAFLRAALVATGAHLAVLSWLVALVQPSMGAGRTAVPSLQVRQIDLAAAAPAWSSTLQQVAPPQAEASPPQSVPPAFPPVLPTVAQAVSSAAGAGPVEYLPRSRLTVAPRPLAQVHVPFPDDVKGFVDLKVQVALFIDPSGAVQRVRLDTEGVPPGFARTIQAAFLAARFTPGEVHSLAVASLIRLEVEFGTGPAR